MARSFNRSNRRSQSTGCRFRCSAWLLGSICLVSLGCTAATVVPRAEATRPISPRLHSPAKITTERPTARQQTTAELVDAPPLAATDDRRTRDARLVTNADEETVRFETRTASALEPKDRSSGDSDDEQVEIATLRALRDAHPQSARDQNKVGKLLLNTAAKDEGLEALQQAVALAPRKVEYACDLAAAYLGRNEPDAARRTLLEARFRMPLERSLPLALARLEESTGDWQRASDAYRQTLEIDPHDRSSRRHRARCLYLLSDFEAARVEFERCTDSQGEDLSLAEGVLYGDACLRTGRFAAARDVLQNLSQRSPVRSREVELLRVLCEIRCGDRIRAREILDTAEGLWPDDPRIAALRSRAKIEADMPNTASDMIATEWSPARKPPLIEQAAGEEVAHAPEPPREFREPIESPAAFLHPVRPAEPASAHDSSGPLIVPRRPRNVSATRFGTSVAESRSESESETAARNAVSENYDSDGQFPAQEPTPAHPAEGWSPTNPSVETELPVIAPRRRH